MLRYISDVYRYIMNCICQYIDEQGNALGITEYISYQIYDAEKIRYKIPSSKHDFHTHQFHLTYFPLLFI